MAMSVAAALRELKTLDARITSTRESATFVAAVTRDTERIAGRYRAEFNRDAEASWASVNDLMARRMAIKAAIVKSNAETIIKIGNTEYTVAGAIEHRKHSIGYSRALLKRMQEQWTSANKTIEATNAKLRATIEAQYAEVIKNDARGGAELVNAAFERQALSLVNPIELANKIAALAKEIEEFDAGFDLAINASNYATMIEV